MARPFDYTAEYNRKLCTADEAARVVKSGDWIDISMGTGFPSLMDAAIAKRKDELREVKIRGYLIFDPIQMGECDPERKHFVYNSWHMSGYERKLCDRGLCNFNPMVFRNLSWYYSQFLTVNVAMMAVTPMNEHGYFNFAGATASARSTLDKADVVILEINENLPWVYGGLDECIHISDVDMIVEGPHGPLPSVKSPAANEAEMKIAEYVVQNMADGSTLQLGIGSLPNAVGQMIAKSDLRDLGIHTEMLCDSYLDMYKAGKITNNQKKLDRYKSIFGLAIGSPDLYDWIRENPGVVTYPISYCNDPANVGKQDNFVSINNCISVDLYGQICAESSGTRQISGTGGQLDFLEGAALSRGGKAFICLTSSFTDKQGNVKSRINPLLSPGDIVTDPRSQAYYIVTEYGVALGLTDFSGTVGGNISGTSDLAPLDQQADMIVEWMPDAKKVGLLYCSAEANSQYQVDEVQKYLEAKGVTATQYAFSDSNDLSSVCQKAADENDALYVPTDNTVAANTGIVDGICRPAKKPVFAGEEGICSGCGVATLSISYYDLGYTTGEMAVKILKGESNVSDMPIEYTDVTKKYNKAICDDLGLTVPEGYEAIEG